MKKPTVPPAGLDLNKFESNLDPAEEKQPSQTKRQQKRRHGCLSGVICSDQCFTGNLLGLHRQARAGGWTADHYRLIAEAHGDRYPVGYWLWMRCAEGAQR